MFGSHCHQTPLSTAAVVDAVIPTMPLCLSGCQTILVNWSQILNSIEPHLEVPVRNGSI